MPSPIISCTRSDGYIAFMEGRYEGLMDNEGNVVISPSLGYRTIKEFVDGVAIGFRLDHRTNEGGWGLLNVQGEKVTEFKYWYIEPFAGHYLYLVDVTPSRRKNLMWNDGTLVFAENFHTIFKNSYRNGYVIVSNTIPKTKTTPTPYPKGLVHINGEVLLNVEYDDIHWMAGYDDILWIKRKGYIGYVRVFYGEHIGIEIDVTLPNLWIGVKGTICEGCIYSKGIDPEGNGCGKLFARSFRDRNLAGRCEYRKRSLTEPSEFELRRILYWKEQRRIADPVFEHCKLLCEFVEEHLDGDIERLKTFDLRRMIGDPHYDNPQSASNHVRYLNISRAICVMAFHDVYGREMFDSKGRFSRECGFIMDDNLLDIKKIYDHSLSDDPHSALFFNVGNIWYDPSNLIGYPHGMYFDQSLLNLKQTLEKYKYKPRKNELFKKKYIEQGGFGQLMHDLLMDDFFDYYTPEPVMGEVRVNFNYTKPLEFNELMNKYFSICQKVIPHRATLVIDKLRKNIAARETDV